jgi:4-amino-4-deoxy-L-arabinose transferase-like glycosyltransferase
MTIPTDDYSPDEPTAAPAKPLLRDDPVRDAVVVGIITFALALAVIVEISDWAGFRMSVQRGTDMRVYVDQAFGILDGGTWPEEKPFYRAPLYPYALAMMMAVKRTLFGVAVFQAVLYALSTVLVMLTARRIGGTLAGWIAASCLVLYGGAMYFVTVLHSTVVEMFLAALFLYVWTLLRAQLRSSKDSSADDLPSEQGSEQINAGKRYAVPILSILAGITFTLLCLVRPNFLALAPVAAVGMLWEAGKGRRWWAFRKMLPGAAVCCLVVGLVVVRNNQYSDSLVLLTTNGGTTWRNSNSTDSAVYNFIYPKGELMSPATAEFWRHQGRKALGYWRSYEFPQNVNYYLFLDDSRVLRVLRLPFAILGALFLLGCIRLRHRMRDVWPCLAMFWLYYLSIAAFFVIGRFRIPVVPAMCVVIALFLVDLIRDWDKHRDIVGIYVLAFILLAIVMRPGETYRTPVDYRNIGSCALSWFDGAGAEAAYRQSNVLLDTIDNDVMVAAAMVMQGRVEDALEVIVLLRAEHPRFADLLKSEITLRTFLGQQEMVDELTRMAGPEVLQQANDPVSQYRIQAQDMYRAHPVKLKRFVDGARMHGSGGI